MPNHPLRTDLPPRKIPSRIDIFSLPSPLFGRRRPPEIQRHSRHERVTPTLAEREKANTKEREREEERRRDEEEEEEDAFYARLNV